ncbi:MAG: FAD-dependent oxidoreductase [Alsobacter sp.]
MAARFSPGRERLLVIGNGMVATRFLERLLALAPDRFAVTVVGAEAWPAYNRVLLSSLLAGEVADGDLTLRPEGWAEAQGISMRLGRRVAMLDAPGRTATLDDGEVLGFDLAVLATGSDAIRLPLPGMDLPGAMTFRDRTDVEAMSNLSPGSRAVVIGGGLLGIEAATGLAKAGHKVTLVHLMDRLMERQLDAAAARMLLEAVEEKGVRVLLQADSAAVLGEERVEALALKDGRVLPADLVVCAVGVKPAIDVARRAGVVVGRGVQVDDGLATSAADIFAIGECAEHRGLCYGLVEPGYEQARVLAERLAGGDAAYAGSVVATNLKVSGVGVFSAGRIEAQPGDEDLVFVDRARRHYRRLVLNGNRLAGVVLHGETGDALWYLGLLRSGADVSGLRGSLVFGRAIADLQAA